MSQRDCVAKGLRASTALRAAATAPGTAPRSSMAAAPNCRPASGCFCFWKIRVAMLWSWQRTSAGSRGRRCLCASACCCSLQQQLLQVSTAQRASSSAPDWLPPDSQAARQVQAAVRATATRGGWTSVLPRAGPARRSEARGRDSSAAAAAALAVAADTAFRGLLYGAAKFPVGLSSLGVVNISGFFLRGPPPPTPPHSLK